MFRRLEGLELHAATCCEAVSLIHQGTGKLCLNAGLIRADDLATHSGLADEFKGKVFNLKLNLIPRQNPTRPDFQRRKQHGGNAKQSSMKGVHRTFQTLSIQIKMDLFRFVLTVKGQLLNRHQETILEPLLANDKSSLIQKSFFILEYYPIGTISWFILFDCSLIQFHSLTTMFHSGDIKQQ